MVVTPITAAALRTIDWSWSQGCLVAAATAELHVGPTALFVDITVGIKDQRLTAV